MDPSRAFLYPQVRTVRALMRFRSCRIEIGKWTNIFCDWIWYGESQVEMLSCCCLLVHWSPPAVAFCCNIRLRYDSHGRSWPVVSVPRRCTILCGNVSEMCLKWVEHSRYDREQKEKPDLSNYSVQQSRLGTLAPSSWTNSWAVTGPIQLIILILLGSNTTVPPNENRQWIESLIWIRWKFNCGIWTAARARP